MKIGGAVLVMILGLCAPLSVAAAMSPPPSPGSSVPAAAAAESAPVPAPPRSAETAHPALFAFFFEVKRERHWLVSTMLYTLLCIVGLIIVYAWRHYRFTLNRLFGRQRHPYLDIDIAEWPPVTVVVPAHNEETVIQQVVESLAEVDYPRDRLTIMPVDDRSTDKTGEIIDEIARRYPDQVVPFHRKDGKPGKAAALKDATGRVKTGILLVFDADYIPGKGLIKQLVAPFFDPEVGAMMGRVVPLNVERNLLTRLLDLERSGGYQVDQQARMNMHLVPQYGGTVGGVRLSALNSVGGWDEEALAEDTDITYRLLLGGWKTVYQNRSECYEEVPETWAVRLRQLRRWAMGHNHATGRYSIPLLRSKRTSWTEKLDGLLLLGVYAMSPVLLLGWLLTLTLFFLGEHLMYGVIAILAVASYGALGNFAAFFEIGAAARLDGRREATRLLAFNVFSFLVSLMAITAAGLAQLLPLRMRQRLVWHRTHRFRRRGQGS